MMYPYLTLADDTEITHSQLIKNGDFDTVEVHFERAVEGGFLSARCQLPDYKWIFNKGFSAEDIAFFQELLEHNAHLFFRYALQGGSSCA